MKKYLITDPKYYTNDEITFKQTLRNVLKKNKVDFACFRDKESDNFEALAKVFIQTCIEENIENIFLNSDFILAKKLGFHGVHLTSTQFKDIKKAKELGLLVTISCHSIDDIKNAKANDVDFATYSPIFDTPNKGKAKGIENLKLAIEEFKDMKIIALGGIINKNQLSQIAKTKAFAFASIRYFI
ncbi:thiamine phosphate synthase [Aliarcobacter butzleri]|uniref:thiamine phosphate synthase n=1 Tax=Aliarcobacter butzleri TaxID=28197 RepID=UPI00125FEB1F|nr:thiamine phosphate synthase [Aliarcobacter butzleri]